MINGSPLEPGISQQQALTLLQQPREAVELVLARDRPPAGAAATPTVVNTVSDTNHDEMIDRSVSQPFSVSVAQCV